MLTSMLGVALMFFAANQAAEIKPYPKGTVYYEYPTRQGGVPELGVTVRPVSEFRYHNVTRQAYDYSCGSAALTTVLNQYLGRQFQERQIMEGLLRFGETEKIVKRRGFSLLDMKRLVTALGHPSGGFRADFSDIETLDHPAIVPIAYGGFKHFVVLKTYKDGHVYVADPALGNISFTEAKFKEIWQQNVLFIVFPNGFAPHDGLELTDHDLRLLDDKTINRLAFEEFPPLRDFTKPIEQWADKASTLQPVLITDDDGVERVINVPTRTYYRK
ncbi:peptidase C39, bacteriocin processing [Alcanivorax hongdengensis A-11-3]|uniref:Peptidase C39, bacteriocin processing n=1 Tax=Alcanivorax hongdengensis A-11-3 TaxID=1177179 RepID=L0W7E1_9GAMM|nr:C39 family peptidase [Alcanivorax hongdengensis]EKF72811.1 peptidase C39, bacteriocin processing [Alcanivorax hongdengensis A-11-3]